jgi:hypothetical protein
MKIALTAVAVAMAGLLAFAMPSLRRYLKMTRM